MENTELLLDKIGGKGKYQIIVSLLLLICGIGTDFCLVFLTLQVSFPIGYYKISDINYQNNVNININNSYTYSLIETIDYNNIVKLNETYYIKGEVTYDFCEKAGGAKNIIIDNQLSVHNWEYDYSLHCDKFHNMLLSNTLFIGSLLGLIILQLATNNRLNYLFNRYINNRLRIPISINLIYKENLIKLFVLMFSFSMLLILINSYYITLLMSIIHGTCFISIFILRSSIIIEMTSKNYRSYFISFQILSSIIIGTACPLLYKDKSINLRHIYLYLGLLLFVNFIFLHLILKVNPRSLIINNSIDEAIKSAIYIGEVNNVFSYKIDSEKNIISYKSETQVIKNEYVKIIHKYDDNNKKNDIINNNNNNKSRINIKEYFSHYDLAVWIINNYTNHELNTICLDRSVINKTLESDSYNKNNDIEIINKSNKMVGKIHLNLIYITILNIFALVVVYLNMFEVSNYSNNVEQNSTDMFKIYSILSEVLAASLYFLLSYIMNIEQIGRKGTIIINIGLCLIIRLYVFIVYFFFNNSEYTLPIYLYFLQKSISNSCQIPLYAILNESLTTKLRVNYYSKISIIVKICCVFVPILKNYIDYLSLSLMYCIFCIITIVITVFIQETNNLELKDF